MSQIYIFTCFSLNITSDVEADEGPTLLFFTVKLYLDYLSILSDLFVYKNLVFMGYRTLE